MDDVPLTSSNNIIVPIKDKRRKSSYHPSALAAISEEDEKPIERLNLINK